MGEKEILTCKVMGNEEIAAEVYRLTIESMEVALGSEPGQFVNVYLDEKDKLLPRPISVCWTDGALVSLVYGVVGDGTKVLSRYSAGDKIRISTPLGNGYDLSFAEEEPAGDGKTAGREKTTGREKTAILVGGGIGVPPLMELTYALTQKNVKVTAVIGFKDEPFLLKPLMKAGADVYLATDSGSMGFHGNVVDLIRQEGLTADAYFACGPRPMLRALTEHCASIGKDVQVSMEERMGCGYGACVGCVISVAGAEGTPVRKKVCKDGPVFWGSEVIWNE